MDPHIFADPDPGSQNLGDPTDPDSKHCLLMDVSKVCKRKGRRFSPSPAGRTQYL